MRIGRRQRAILLPGPLHLFRTGGMYYAYELAQDFDLILVLEATYREDLTVQALLRVMPYLEVHYLPARSKMLGRHRYYRDFFRVLTDRHRPALVLQHNNNYLWNMYLFHFARRANPTCVRMIYLAGHGFIDASAFVNLAKLEQIDMLARRFNLPRPLAAPAFVLWSWSYFTLHHRILPFLHIGSSLMPRENYLTAATEWPEREPNTDIVLSTHRLNVPFLQQQHPKSRVELVAHPSFTIGMQLHRALYGDIGDKRGIAVFPSNAYAMTKMRDEGWSVDQTVSHFGELWAEAIRRLLRRLPDYRLLWKLHPSSAEDPLMNAVMQYVKDKVPQMNIRPITDSAERLALANHIVLSDVSNILYWSRMIPGLVPISLDVFGVRGGNEMRVYEGIIYVSTLEKLDTMSLEKSSVDAANPRTVARAVTDAVHANQKGRCVS